MAPGNRLKTINIDPLEVIGLPSKGELGLTSYSAQERYFETLRQRCLAIGLKPAREVYKHSGHADTVSTALKNLSLASPQVEDDWSSCNQDELAVILSAMRKLRESLIATKRYDGFAVTAYLFIIRSTISLQHDEYHPALLHAVNVLIRQCDVADHDRDELIAYEVLDLAGRQNAVREAWEYAWHKNLFTSTGVSQQCRNDEVQQALRQHRQSLRLTLKSAIHHNVLMFHHHWTYLTSNERLLLQPLEQRLTVYAVACLSRAYFTAETKFVEKALNTSLSDKMKFVRDSYRLLEGTKEWHVEEDKVVFRRPRAR